MVLVLMMVGKLSHSEFEFAQGKCVGQGEYLSSSDERKCQFEEGCRLFWSD